MIRYGGKILESDREEFLSFVVDNNIEFLRVVANNDVSCYIVYFTNRTDELVFRLRYPKMIKEIDNDAL